MDQTPQSAEERFRVCLRHYVSMLEFNDDLMRHSVTASSADPSAGSRRAAGRSALPGLQSAQGQRTVSPQMRGATAYSDTAPGAARNAPGTPFEYLYHYEQGYYAKHVILCVSPSGNKVVFTAGSQQWVEWLTGLGFVPSPFHNSSLEVLCQYLKGLPPGLGLGVGPGQVEITWKGNPLYFVQSWRPRRTHGCS